MSRKIKVNEIVGLGIKISAHSADIKGINLITQPCPVSPCTNICHINNLNKNSVPVHSRHTFAGHVTRLGLCLEKFKIFFLDSFHINLNFAHLRAKTFKSTLVKHVKENQYLVEGEMTVKDVTQKITVPFHFFGIKTHPFDQKSEVAGFEARIDIDRLTYNVGGGKFYDMGVVGKDVEVLITLETIRKK